MRRYAVVDVTQEGEDSSLSAHMRREHLTDGDIQDSEQLDCAISDTVVDHPFDVTRPHRQQELGALKRSNLGLFVRTPNHGMVQRTPIQSYDIAKSRTFSIKPRELLDGAK